MAVRVQDVECVVGKLYCIKNFRAYYLSGTLNNNLGETCTKGESIIDCELVTAATDNSSLTCYGCKYGKSVTADETGCQSYTIDKNCRK